MVTDAWFDRANRTAFGPLRRIEGWESRLIAAVEAARWTRYELGVHDCFRVACHVVEALTGVDRWPEFAGRYHDKRGAVALLAEHGKTFEAAFDWFFDTPHVPVQEAARGDIVALRTADGEKHLGVCLGCDVAFLAPEGLLFLQRSSAHCAWRVG
jgi:hypothetical protein